jgi:hypothetical protein
VAAYQLVVLVELTFKVMVICSISTEYNFNMEDYRKIVTKVTQKGSRIAVEARNLITDWVSKCHSIRRTRVQWMSAWASHPRNEETGRLEYSNECFSSTCVLRSFTLLNLFSYDKHHIQTTESLPPCVDLLAR